MDTLRSLLPAAGSLQLRQVCNRAPPQERPRLPSSAVCRELVSWGGDILLRRAVQAGARTWPELTHVYAASRIVLALCAVHRGEFAAASAQLPWAALAPPQVLAWARATLQGLLPQWVMLGLDNDPTLALLAAVALLHELHATPESSHLPAPSWSAAITLGRLRAAYESLRSVLQADAAMDRLRLSGSSHRRPGIGNRTQASGPAALGTALQRRGAGPFGDVASYAASLGAPSTGAGAWLFAGASASPRGGDGASHPHPHPRPHAGHLGTRAMTGGGERRSPLQRRPMTSGSLRGTGRRQGESSHRERMHSNAPNAMAGYADGPKELLMSPVYPDQAGGGPAGIRLDPAVQPHAGAAPRGVAAVGSMQQRAGSGQGVGPRTRADDPSFASDALAVPVGTVECLQVDDERVALLLVRQQRYRPPLMRFCIPSSDTAWFKGLFGGSRATPRGMRRWMVSELVDEHVPHTLRPLSVRRHGGADDMLLDTPSPWRWLGDERIFSLLTVSLLDDRLRPEARGWNPQFMPRNSFTVMQHAGVDGHDRLYLAYFLHREHSGNSGVNAGFLEVEVNAAGQLSIADKVHGAGIVGDTLDVLVASIEKLTGLRCTDSADHVLEGDMAPRARNLFVDINETRSLQADHPLPLNRALDPFSPVVMEAVGYARPFTLYLGSFLALEDRILFADANGLSGALYYIGGASAGEARALRCDTLDVCTFAALHGLQSGRRYTADEVVQALQENGLLSMPQEASAASYGDGRLYVQGDQAAAPAALMASSGPLPASTYVLDAGRVQYTDHDGRAGSLQLRCVDRWGDPRYRWLGAGNERRFAARIRLHAGRDYTGADIRRLFEKDGFVEGA